MTTVQHNNLPISDRAMNALIGDAIKAATQQLEDERKSNRFELRGNNYKVLFDDTKELLLCGPTRTGKSFAWLVKMHRFAVRYPTFRGLIVRKTRASLSESALQTLEEHVLGSNHPLVVNGPRRSYRSSYRYSNGAEIVIDGMDKKTKIMSTEFDMIFVQEATEITIDDLEYLLTRLSNTGIPLDDGAYFHQLAMDCNPDAPKHWLKLRCDAGTTKLLESKHEDNPRFYSTKARQWTRFGFDYVFNTLSKLSGVRFKRFRLGEWAAAEGAIYEDFNEDVHVVDAIDILPNGRIPSDWSCIRVIDFGYRNPFVCQWWAIDPNSLDMIEYREIYVTGQLVEDLAPKIVEYSRDERIVATICDHDAEDRATLTKHGIPNIAAYKGISLGIQAVQTRLKQRHTGKIRFIRDALVEVDETLEFAKKPTSTIDELPGYVWERDSSGKAVKEVPHGEDDHGCDATRYAVAWVDQVGAELEKHVETFIEDDLELYAISPF